MSLSILFLLSTFTILFTRLLCFSDGFICVVHCFAHLISFFRLLRDMARHMSTQSEQTSLHKKSCCVKMKSTPILSSRADTTQKHSGATTDTAGGLDGGCVKYRCNATCLKTRQACQERTCRGGHMCSDFKRNCRCSRRCQI